jgi:hypothetical protein
MNANELADELKEISLIADNHTKIVLDIAATMLRQQQEKLTKYELRHAEQRKRIAELEAENKFFKDLMGDVEILRKASER